MNYQYWSYLLTAVGVFGLWLAGRKNPLGWAVGFLAQGLWATYAVVTGQWGFLVSAFAYSLVYSRNFYAWVSERNDDVVRWIATRLSIPALFLLTLLGVEEEKR